LNVARFDTDVFLPSTIFHISDSLASHLLWIPDHDVLQAFRLDLYPTLGPRNLIYLATIHVNRIGELPDVNFIPLLKYGGGLSFCGGCSLIEVVLARERGDLDIVSRSPDVVVEESLEP